MKRIQWFIISAIFFLLSLSFYSSYSQSNKNRQVYDDLFDGQLDSSTSENRIEAKMESLYGGQLLIQSNIASLDGHIHWLFVCFSGGISLACLICGLLEKGK